MTIKKDVGDLVHRGESDSIEFKKTTGQLARAAETFCAFLNGDSGTVRFGVGPDGKIAGQLVSDSTLRDVAQLLTRFDPPAPLQVRRVDVPDLAHQILVLPAGASHESRPFTFDGRPYERVGPTTSVMPQEKYQHNATKTAATCRTARRVHRRA
jgi:ATP-dependent DNA helicase RecG